jgi:hypothetical protein
MKTAKITISIPAELSAYHLRILLADAISEFAKARSYPSVPHYVARAYPDRLGIQYEAKVEEVGQRVGWANFIKENGIRIADITETTNTEEEG